MNRTDAKEMFIDALNADLPEGLAEFLKIGLPAFEYETMDEETSISWQGNLSKYLCGVFALFEGLFPLEIPLRMGQRNATQQGMLLAALKATRTVGAYYSGNIKAAAAAINEQLEGITITNGTAEISKEDLERLQFGGFTLQEMIASETLESEFLGGDVVNYLESLNMGIKEVADNLIDDVAIISDAVLMGLKSLSRMIVNLVSEE